MSLELRRRERLASALIGEIVAVFRHIEEHGLEARLDALASGATTALDLAGFLPRFAVYQAVLRPSRHIPAAAAARDRARFTRLGGLQSDLEAVASGERIGGERERRSCRAT